MLTLYAWNSKVFLSITLHLFVWKGCEKEETCQSNTGLIHQMLLKSILYRELSCSIKNLFSCCVHGPRCFHSRPFQYSRLDFTWRVPSVWVGPQWPSLDAHNKHLANTFPFNSFRWTTSVVSKNSLKHLFVSQSGQSNDVPWSALIQFHNYYV